MPKSVWRDWMRQTGSRRIPIEEPAAVQPAFGLSSDNAATIAAICVRLDGLPLAIELAAARIRALSVEQIAARLADRFELLALGNRAAPLRQQTLRATVEWMRREGLHLSQYAGGSAHGRAARE